MTIPEALAANPGQRQASKHMQGTGQVLSPIRPGCKQQHPPKNPGTDNFLEYYRSVNTIQP